MFQNGGWPWYEGAEHGSREQANERYNREGLVDLLRGTGEETVELYGVWDGDFDFTTPPVVREEIELTAILNAALRLREQGFYVVHIV
jgi:hypothetical protein